MSTMTQWEPFRNFLSLQGQLNSLLEDGFFRARGNDSALTAWVPAVDIYETANDLVTKADLPDIDSKHLYICVENNTLTIRGERKFESAVTEDGYLRVERGFGSLRRSFSLPNTVNSEAIRAEYKDGVLTVTLPKREESKRRQIKVAVNANN